MGGTFDVILTPLVQQSTAGRTFDPISSIWQNSIRSKFGQQQLIMVNYACGFNQTETGKYFEWIIINNYSPKWRWLAVDIYRAAKLRAKYPPLATDTEVNTCFRIY